MVKNKKTLGTFKLRLRLLVSLVCSLFAVMVFSAEQAGVPNPQGAAINELLAKAEGLKTNSKMPDPASSKIAVAKKQKNENDMGDTPASRHAFAKVLNNLMPLTTRQIVTLHKLLNKTKRAVATSPETPPKPTSSTILGNVAPGSTPPVIRLQKGYVTSLVFLDSTGAVWPIAAYDVANSAGFDIKYTLEQPGSMLIQAKTAYRPSNMVVMLKGSQTPITLTLVPGQKSVDYLDYLRVPGLGPNASPVVSGLPDASNPELLKVLDGIPPDGSTELKVAGGTAKAWLVGKIMYLRTRLTLLSPSWTATMSSPDGTHAYQLISAPVLLASNRGNMVQLTVQGF